MRLSFWMRPGKMTFHICFRSRIIRFKFWWILYIFMQNNHHFSNYLSKKLLFWKTITSKLNLDRMQIFHSSLIFSCLDFLSQTLVIHRTVGERDLFLYTSIYHFYHLQAFRQLVAASHLRCLASSFNCSGCKYLFFSWSFLVFM